MIGSSGGGYFVPDIRRWGGASMRMVMVMMMRRLRLLLRMRGRHLRREMMRMVRVI